MFIVSICTSDNTIGFHFYKIGVAIISVLKDGAIINHVTKGTVLSVCIQCVDTLVLASKHAEGMSLRCDVICALAYCGRHESSHIIKAHTDSARFNKKIICGNLC